LGFKAGLARIFPMGFNIFLARNVSLGFILNLARSITLGFKSPLARSIYIGFTFLLARTHSMGFRLNMARIFCCQLPALSIPFSRAFLPPRFCFWFQMAKTGLFYALAFLQRMAFLLPSLLAASRLPRIGTKTAWRLSFWLC